MSSVRSPEADFEGDGVIEQRIVRQQAEGLESAEGVLAPSSDDPAGDVAQLRNDATERLGVLVGRAFQRGERLLAFAEALTLILEGLQVRSPALQDSLDVRAHVGHRPRSEPGRDRSVEVDPEQADEPGEILCVPPSIEDLRQPASGIHPGRHGHSDGAWHLAGL